MAVTTLTPGPAPGRAAAARGRTGRAALPRDLELLSDLLGGVLRDRGGEELLQALGELRQAAAQSGKGRADRIQRIVAAIPSHAALAIVRACTMHLAIANVADEQRLVRMLRAAEEQADVRNCAAFDIRLVLTAAPTDIARRSVLSKRRTVARCIDQLDDPRPGPAERRRLELEMGIRLASSGAGPGGMHNVNRFRLAASSCR